MSKRIILVVSYEGNPKWVDDQVLRYERVLFNKLGTRKLLFRGELVGPTMTVRELLVREYGAKSHTP